MLFQPRVRSKGAVRLASDTETEACTVPKPPEQELPGNGLRQAGRTGNPAARGLDCPNDSRSRRPAVRSMRVVRHDEGRHMTNDHSRGQEPQRDAHNQDERRRDEHKAVLAPRELEKS